MSDFDPWMDHEPPPDDPPPPPIEEPPPFTRSWAPVNLDAVLDGSYEPVRPTVGQRTDKAGLFYPGKVHTVSSETEAGKTWFALSAAIDELIAGEHVSYLDFEDDEAGVVSRLIMLQVGREVIRERFHYIRPLDPLGNGIHLDDLVRGLHEYQPTLVVIDGITEAMTLHNLDPLNNKDVALFGRILPRRIAAKGPAVACLDHVTKSLEGRGRYALGGVHKLNGLDGAAYLLDNREPFGIGLTGRSTVKIAKDRPGQLKRNGLPSAGGLRWYGDLVLTSHDESFAEVQITPPHVGIDFRPTLLMSRICQALEKHGPLSQRKIVALVKGNTGQLVQALTFLQVDGYVSDKTPHTLLMPYSPDPEDA